jgi:DNA-binding MarR family transcriptional regulator
VPPRRGRKAQTVEADATAAIVELRRIVRFLRLADREVESACGVSVAQLFVLHQLAATPALSIAELATRTLTDQSSVSTVVARLVKTGLVARGPAQEDRRRAELRLTARGKTVLANAPEVPQVRLIETIGRMAPAQRAEVVRSLRALAEGLGAGRVQPRMLFEDEAPRRRR